MTKNLSDDNLWWESNWYKKIEALRKREDKKIPLHEKRRGYWNCRYDSVNKVLVYEFHPI